MFRFLRSSSVGDWVLAVAAWLLLGIARLAIVLLGFGPIERRLGERGVESALDVDQRQRDAARRVGRIVAGASVTTPWTSNCFPQSVTAVILLRGLRTPATVYFGAAINREVASDDRSRLGGHAWVRVGREIVIGASEAEHHTAFVSYS